LFNVDINISIKSKIEHDVRFFRILIFVKFLRHYGRENFSQT